MNILAESRIKAKYAELSPSVFRCWLLEYLTLDINDKDRDSLRLEILRYVAEEGLI
jgi:hypothetical protein